MGSHPRIGDHLDVRVTDDESSAPSLLKKGKFAEAVYSKSIPENIYGALFSTAIAQIWREEGAAVVRVGPEDRTLKKKPCDTNMFKDNSWCNDKGERFILMKFPEGYHPMGGPWEQDSKDLFKLKGVDKLGNYKLSIEDVAKSSKKSSLSNGGKPYKKWDGNAVVQHLSANPEDAGDFLAFNLPYCNINEFEKDDKLSPLRIEEDECDDEVSDIHISLSLALLSLDLLVIS